MHSHDEFSTRTTMGAKGESVPVWGHERHIIGRVGDAREGNLPPVAGRIPCATCDVVSLADCPHSNYRVWPRLTLYALWTLVTSITLESLYPLLALRLSDNVRGVVGPIGKRERDGTIAVVQYPLNPNPVCSLLTFGPCAS